MKSVFILEDNPVVLNSMIDSVNSHQELTVAGFAQDLVSAFAWLDDNSKPDVALVDLGLPDGDGTEIIRHLSLTETLVMVMTVFGDERHVIRALESGAQGYLLKEKSGGDLTNSILDLLSGGSPISPSIARYLLKQYRPSSSAPNQVKLTEKEETVLSLIVKGYSYQEIAKSNNVSVNTISTQVRHLYRKLAVNSRGEAVYEAIQLGLVSAFPTKE